MLKHGLNLLQTCIFYIDMSKLNYISMCTLAIRTFVSATVLLIVFHTPLAVSGAVFYQNTVELSEPNANIFTDSVIYAVKKGDTILLRELITQGAYINVRDGKGWTALDYATKKNKKVIRTILLCNGAKTFAKPLPDMMEGPYVKLIDSKTIEIAYLKHDSISGKSSLKKTPPGNRKTQHAAKLLGISREEISRAANPRLPEKSEYLAEKIFAVGDIHGEYDRVKQLLEFNHVIDKNGNWTWGKGHLVFVGDIFDRGKKVTETLWMIHKLEQQAIKDGGKVHLLLGNHENMIFNGDIRYVADDYYSLCDNLGLSYPDLFDIHTFLGSWLRQKPVMIKINNKVFMHAGISPELCQMKMQIDTVNKIIWQLLNNKADIKNQKIGQFLLGSKGILWYRGLVEDDFQKNVIDEKTLDEALSTYGVGSFVIGHTEVDSISAFFGNKVIDINIPKWNKVIREQGLLIRGNESWVVYDSGEILPKKLKD